MILLLKLVLSFHRSVNRATGDQLTCSASLGRGDFACTRSLKALTPKQLLCSPDEGPGCHHRSFSTEFTWKQSLGELLTYARSALQMSKACPFAQETELKVERFWSMNSFGSQFIYAQLSSSFSLNYVQEDRHCCANLFRCFHGSFSDESRTPKTTYRWQETSKRQTQLPTKLQSPIHPIVRFSFLNLLHGLSPCSWPLHSPLSPICQVSNLGKMAN